MTFMNYMRDVIGEYDEFEWNGKYWGPIFEFKQLVIPHNSRVTAYIAQYKIYCYVNDVVPTINTVEEQHYKGSVFYVI